MFNILIHATAADDGDDGGGDDDGYDETFKLLFRNNAILDLQQGELSIDVGDLKIEQNALLTGQDGRIRLKNGDIEITEGASLDMEDANIYVEKGKLYMQNVYAHFTNAILEINKDFELLGEQITLHLVDSKVDVNGKFKIDGGMNTITNTCLAVQKQIQLINTTSDWGNTFVNAERKVLLNNTTMVLESSSLKLDKGNFALIDATIQGTISAFWLVQGSPILDENSNWNAVIAKYCFREESTVISADLLGTESCQATDFDEEFNCY